MNRNVRLFVNSVWIGATTLILASPVRAADAEADARALSDAVKRSDLGAAAVLLAHGADPDRSGKDFESARSISESRNLVIAHALLAERASALSFLELSKKTRTALETALCPHRDEKVGRMWRKSKRMNYHEDPSEPSINWHAKTMEALGASSEEVQRNWKNARVHDWVFPLRQGPARLTVADFSYDRGDTANSCRSGLLIIRTDSPPAAAGMERIPVEALAGYCRERTKGTPEDITYQVRPFAHLDLNGDGRDEIIVEMGGNMGSDLVAFSEFPRPGEWTPIAAGCEWGD